MKRKALRKLYISLFLLISFIAFCSCKSNTAFTRSLAGLTTKYNIFFNGNEAYKQGVQSMEKSDDDDFTRRLKPHPVYKLVGQEQIADNADFDRAIDKCKKCVQNKSISTKPKRKAKTSKEYRLWLTHGEWNPYIHNAWLLSGKAQFYKGDFDGAKATFSYVERHFWWKPELINECHIWAARCDAVQGYTYEAEAELALVEKDKLSPRLIREFALAEAETLLQEDADTDKIIKDLKDGRKAWLTKEQRNRCDFLIAQLQEEEGKNADAFKSYGQAARAARNYRMQFNARIAQTRVMQNQDLKGAEKKLNRYLRQKRNAEYQDQLYYALGNLALQKHDTLRAISCYDKALDSSTRKGLEEAVAALKLGEITLSRADYLKAQKAYSTAMSIIPKDYPDYKNIAKLSSILDELQTHAESVYLQDSLLQLAALPEDEIISAIDKIIENLKKQEEEEALNQDLAEYNDQKETTTDPFAQSQTQQVVGEKDNSWYFYNKASINFGKTEFQRIWGARKLEDDWRRKNKTEVILDDGSDMADGSVQSEALNGSIAGSGNEATAQVSDDPHSYDYYLAQIPFTAEEKQASNKIIEDETYNMGVIINEKLENFPLAIKTFENLDTRYPESEHRLDAYYAIYLMCLRMGDNAKAERYRQKLISSFPESAYANAISDPDYIQHLRQMLVDQDSLYIKTYNEYLSNNSETVHENYAYVKEHWPLSNLMPKFLFLHALSFVQEGKIDDFRESLEQLTATYPESDVSPLASQMVKGVHEGKTVIAGETAKGLDWKASTLRSDSIGGAAIDSTTIFIDNDTIPHLLLIVYNTDSISQNDLLFEIAKFDFENFLIKDFDLEIINMNDYSVLVISGFNNLDELSEYHNRMDASTTLSLPADIYMVDISKLNFEALIKGKTFDDYFNWVKATYGEGE